MTDLPTIYCFVNRVLPGGAGVGLAALAEDGVLIATQESWTLADGIKAIGASHPVTPTGHGHHRAFAEHYPDGYLVEWVGQDAYPKHVGLQRALDRFANAPSGPAAS